MAIERDFTQNIEQNKALDEEYERERRKQKRRKINQQKQLARG